MLRLILSFFWWFTTFFRSRHDLGFELVALRQQVSVLKRRNARPRLRRWDRLFWVTLRKLWSRWTEVLVVVKPETVVGWHRAGFRRAPRRRDASSIRVECIRLKAFFDKTLPAFCIEQGPFGTSLATSGTESP